METIIDSYLCLCLFVFFKDECSFVSLRDVERAMQVMVWFYNHVDTLGRLMRKVVAEQRREEGEEVDEDDEDDEDDDNQVIMRYFNATTTEQGPKMTPKPITKLASVEKLRFSFKDNCFSPLGQEIYS